MRAGYGPAGGGCGRVPGDGSSLGVMGKQFFKEVKMAKQEKPEKQDGWEVLRCPCCRRRLADAAGKDYVVSLWCRSCKARVLFCSKVQPA